MPTTEEWQAAIKERDDVIAWQRDEIRALKARLEPKTPEERRAARAAYMREYRQRKKQ